MTTQPKWSTPNRKAILISLFLKSGGFCVCGDKDCTIPAHHYSEYIETLIEDWKAEDREDWKAERLAMHSLGETRLPLRGRFSNIARDIFASQQPVFYLEALGISGLTLKPFARVKLASSYMRLYVDLGDSLRGTSKNQKRKAIRYGKPLPQSIRESVHSKVSLAVRDYLNH